MNKFKKILLGTLSVLTLGLFVGTGAKVDAATVTTHYEVNLYDYTDDANITTATDRTISKRVNANDDNNQDVITFSLGSAVAWGTNKGKYTSIGTSGTTRASDRWFKVTIPSGYYVSSFEIQGDSNGNRTCFLGSAASTSLDDIIANTVSNTLQNKPTTATIYEYVETDKRVDCSFAAKDFYINCVDGGMNIYLIDIVLDVDNESGSTSEIADSVTLTFNYQYDTLDETKASKLRFIGTIDGIATATYTNEITDAYFTMDFNGANDRKLSCSKVYSSIKNGDEVLFAAGDTKMYVVFELRNINKSEYKGLAVSDLHFVVEFNDGSSKSIDKTSFNLPDFAI